MIFRHSPSNFFKGTAGRLLSRFFLSLMVLGIAQSTLLAQGISVSVDRQPVSCFGLSDGAATLNPMGGTAPYTYLWNTGATTASVTGLSSGVYAYTVTDAASNTRTGNFSILTPSPVTPNVMRQNVSCFGVNDGSVTLAPSGGVGPYTYLWSNGATTASLSNLAPAPFGFTITDATGCQRSGNFSITTPLAIQPNATVIPVSCFGGSNGAITLNPLQGTPPFTYQWESGATTAGITGLAAGFYRFTITDGNGCVREAGAFVPQPSPVIPNHSTTPVTSCFGTSTGSATLSPSGGTAPYTYLWSNGATTATISGVSAGPYSYTITDVNGCTRLGSLSVLGTNSPIAVTYTRTDVDCFGGDNGTVNLVATGGTAPYTYLWSNGATTASQTGLAAGVYAYTVTDASGCTREGDLSIIEPCPILPSLVRTDITCFGNNDGMATLNPSMGIPPYTILWSTGATTNTITNLVPGPYSYTITDANGCTKVGDFSIVTPWIIIPNLTVTNGVCGGSASLNPFEGTPPFTYLWSNGATTSSVTGLATGTYGYTITDANGCTESGSASITGGSSNLSCAVQALQQPTGGLNNGRARVNLIGGTAPFTYLWNNGETTVMATALPSGTASVTVTDASGCTTECAIQLTPQPSPCVQITDPGTIGFDQTLCGPGNQATLVGLNPGSGGQGPVEYLWMSSTIGGAFNNVNWAPIPGTNSADLTITVYETTYFIRCARSQDCVSFLESNIVTVTMGTDAIVDVTGPEWACANGSAAFFVNTATNNAQITWNFAPPATPGTIQGEVALITFTSFGQVTGSVTVTENGCTASRPISLSVLNNPTLCGTTPPGGTQAADVQVYPNPADHAVMLQVPYSDTLPTEMAIFDVNGKMVSQLRVGEHTSQAEMDISRLTPGLYMIRMVQGTRVMTAKVTKR